MQGESKIPFVKPVRIGNFKLWRSKFQMQVYPDLDEESRKRMVQEKGKVRKESVNIECVNVSNLDGTWKVQIPSTFEMFAVLDSLYSDYSGGIGEKMERARSVFPCLLGNMMYASTIGNGYYHRAVEMVTTCYAYPNMLDKKSDEWKDLKKDTSKLIDDFLVWRKAYDISRAEITEREMKHDELAEQAKKIAEDDETSRIVDNQGGDEDNL